MVQGDTMQKKIDELANLWNKYIKEWADGVNNIDRRNVSSGASDKRDAGKSNVV